MYPSSLPQFLYNGASSSALAQLASDEPRVAAAAAACKGLLTASVMHAVRREARHEVRRGAALIG